MYPQAHVHAPLNMFLDTKLMNIFITADCGKIFLSILKIEQVKFYLFKHF